MPTEVKNTDAPTGVSVYRLANHQVIFPLLEYTGKLRFTRLPFNRTQLNPRTLLGILNESSLYRDRLQPKGLAGLATSQFPESLQIECGAIHAPGIQGLATEKTNGFGPPKGCLNEGEGRCPVWGSIQKQTRVRLVLCSRKAGLVPRGKNSAIARPNSRDQRKATQLTGVTRVRPKAAILQVTMKGQLGLKNQLVEPHIEVALNRLSLGV